MVSYLRDALSPVQLPPVAREILVSRTLVASHHHRLAPWDLSQKRDQSGQPLSSFSQSAAGVVARGESDPDGAVGVLPQEVGQRCLIAAAEPGAGDMDDLELKVANLLSSLGGREEEDAPGLSAQERGHQAPKWRCGSRVRGGWGKSRFKNLEK